MNKELESEAEKYADYSNDCVPLSFGGKFNESHKKTFIAGATSKWVEKQKLELALAENKSILNMIKLHGGNERIEMPLIWRIEELEQKLSQL